MTAQTLPNRGSSAPIGKTQEGIQPAQAQVAILHHTGHSVDTPGWPTPWEACSVPKATENWSAFGDR